MTGQSEILFPDAAAIRAACAIAEPESLSLEFKEKTDPTNAIPSKDDRRNIAKSVSAMANGSGGLIVFGVKTIKVEGADCASEVRPINDIATFKSQFDSSVFSLISPEVKSWQSRIVEEHSVPGAGYLVCEVDTSLDRPHMCTAANEHTYYRRSFQGDLPMTPLEVREQILAIREAQLCVRIRRGGGTFSSMSDWLSVKAQFNFLLENTGQRMCKNPFLRVQTDPFLSGYAKDPLTSRHKTDFAPGTLLHIDDLLPSLTLSFHARVVRHQLYNSLHLDNKTMALDSIKIYDGNDELHSPTISDKVEIGGVALNLMFGAENASTKKQEVTFDAMLLKRLAFHASLSSLIDSWGGRPVLSWLPEREAEFFGKDDFELLVG